MNIKRFYELDLAACQMNMSFGKAAGSNSKKSSWKHLAFLHCVADLTPKKRFLWTRSCRPADRNMSVGRPAGSSSKAPLRTPSQKIHHLCYYGFFLTFYLSYVASFYVMYCFIFFPSHSPRNARNKRVWCSSDYKIWNIYMQSGFYIPEHLSKILAGAVSPKVWPVSGVLTRFLDGLNEKHVFLDFQMT